MKRKLNFVNDTHVILNLFITKESFNKLKITEKIKIKKQKKSNGKKN